MDEEEKKNYIDLLLFEMSRRRSSWLKFWKRAEKEKKNNEKVGSDSDRERYEVRGSHDFSIQNLSE